jgi:hypothetical protein
MNSRRKGHDFERLLVNIFKTIGPEAKRGLQGRGGGEAADVINTPFHVEAKRGRRPNILAAYEQAVRDNQGLIPVAVTKADNGRILATLALDDLLGARWLAQ